MRVELIEREIELAEFEGTTFDIYLNIESFNIWAKGNINGVPSEIQYRVRRFMEDEFKDSSKNSKANIDWLIKNYRHEYLKSRLGRYTEADEVSIGDIFMYGHFDKIGGVISHTKK